MSNIFFEKKRFFGGLLNLLAICLITFAGSHLLFKEYILSVFLTLIIVFVLLIFLNKKWFNNIIIDDKRIIIEYPFNIIGNKTKTINYKDGIINEVIYYGYMYRTPSHCKIISKEKIFRFNCTLEEVKGVFDIFKANSIKVSYANSIKVSYNDEKKVDYR